MGRRPRGGDSVNCATCRHPIGTTTFVTQGLLGTYYECEWCFYGQPRPVYEEPELITDTFEPKVFVSHPGSLDAILDKLTNG
jgi:hypothetical protein